MPRKPKPKPDNPEQFKRFTELVREVGAKEPSDNFDRVLKRVSGASRPAQKSPPLGRSDKAHRARSK
jgi:hypothetical protein